MKRTKVTMDKETILFSFKNDNDLQRFLDKLHIIIPKEKVVLEDVFMNPLKGSKPFRGYFFSMFILKLLLQQLEMIFRSSGASFLVF